MVTLIQHQQTPDNNLYQKEQQQDHCIVNVSPQLDSPRDSPNHSGKFDQLRSPKDSNNTVIAVASGCNGSVGDTSTQCSDIDDENDVVCGNNNEQNEEEEEEDDDDDDDEDDDDDTDLENGEWTADLPVSAVVQHHHQQVAVPNGNVILPNADPSTFGDICVKNSTNVHLGNKTFYKGPVTIKQFVYTSPTSVQGQQETNECDGARTSDANASDLSTSKADAGLSRPILSQKNDFDKVTKWLWTWRCAALLCTLALIIVTMIVVGSVLLTHRYDAPPAPIFPEIPDSSLEGVIVDNVRFVERNEWGAQPPTEPLTKMKLPVPYVIISHTATEFCTTQSECTFHVRFAQTFHIESRKWADIGYNFLVGGDGLAYVGRSWDYMGAHAFGYNNKSIGISFIGTFNTVVPPKAQLHAAQKIIELGVQAGKIAKDYKLLGHRQVSKTLSPGDALYSIIKTWPHWAPRP